MKKTLSLLLVSIAALLVSFPLEAHTLVADPAGLHHLVAPHSRSLAELPLVQLLAVAWMIAAGISLRRRMRASH